MVCYDLRFPVWSRNRDEYDLLCYVASWPERRISAWEKLLQARAIENQSYVAAANRVGTDGDGVAHVGSSCLVDPMGENIWDPGEQAGVGTHVLSAETLRKLRRQLPFLRDADDFTLHP